MLQDAIRSRSHKSGSEAVRKFSWHEYMLHKHKMEVCLLKFYSGRLRALLLALSEGVWSITCHYNCLLGTVILAFAAICQSIIDVTSQ